MYTYNLCLIIASWLKKEIKRNSRGNAVFLNFPKLLIMADRVTRAVKLKLHGHLK